MADEMIVIEPQGAIMPVVSVDDMLARYKTITEIKDRIMSRDIDYGVIPGTGSKPTLLKPGAEKLCTAFGLVPHFERLSEPDLYYLMNANGDDVPFIIYEYRCTLTTRDGRYTVGQGVGSCNSWEKKYRYRKASLECPLCGQEARKSKQSDGYYCWTKTGGCGAQFGANDGRLTGQKLGNVPNPDIADIINTLDKMAQKRALIAATLIAVGASEFFTQDIEDIHSYQPPTTPETPQEAPGEIGEQAPARMKPLSDIGPTQITTPVCELTPSYVREIGFKMVSERDPGMTHINHYTNRWRDRYDVHRIDEITVSFADFIQTMSIPSEEWAIFRETSGMDKGIDDHKNYDHE
jgi:hypothetical protein